MSHRIALRNGPVQSVDHTTISRFIDELYNARTNCQMMAPLTAPKDRRSTAIRPAISIKSAAEHELSNKRQWPTFTNGLRTLISQ